MTSGPSVLILGIGNLLWADEGFGVRALEAMHAAYVFPDHVRLVDGGTQGIYLVQIIREADVLIVFDAVDYGLAPGTMKRVEGEEVPRFLGAKKVSPTAYAKALALFGEETLLHYSMLISNYASTAILLCIVGQELHDHHSPGLPV